MRCRRSARACWRWSDCASFHAFAVFVVTAGILAWSVSAWRMGLVTAGDVVLTTSLGFTVLHASRDLAMAMVDLVQHFAKLGEAVQVLGLPHEMRDAPGARSLICLGGSVALLNVCFSYPDGERVLQDFTLHVPAGQKLGLVGRSGAGKSTLLALVQRLYDAESGHVLIDEQDVSKVTQESLRQAIAVVQQDISLFHRSLLENLRYGRPTPPTRKSVARRRRRAASSSSSACRRATTRSSASGA